MTLLSTSGNKVSIKKPKSQLSFSILSSSKVEVDLQNEKIKFQDHKVILTLRKCSYHNESGGKTKETLMFPAKVLGNSRRIKKIFFPGSFSCKTPKKKRSHTCLILNVCGIKKAEPSRGAGND